MSNASFGWKWDRHWLYHGRFREVVFRVLVVVDRLKRESGGKMIIPPPGGEGVGGDRDAEAVAGDDTLVPLPLLPVLPPEIWLFIMHFFQRSWWPAGVA